MEFEVLNDVDYIWYKSRQICIKETKTSLVNLWEADETQLLFTVQKREEGPVITGFLNTQPNLEWCHELESNSKSHLQVILAPQVYSWDIVSLSINPDKSSYTV